MTIPSVKASTVNVDQGSDKISLARADIKQNIDNVNEIIDHLGAAGSYLPCYINYFSVTTSQGDTPAPIEESPNLITAGNTGISISTGDSAGGPSKISIPAGTYLIETNRSPSFAMTGTFIQAMGFRDSNTDQYWTAQSVDQTGSQAGTSGIEIGSFQLMGLKTFGSTAEIELFAVSTNTNNPSLVYQTNTNPDLGDSAGGPVNNNNVGLLVKITKIS